MPISDTPRSVGPKPDPTAYLRQWAMPHVLCPGCAHGIVLRSCLEAVAQLELDQDKVAMVAGIGCSSRLIAYADFCTLHGTHGRAPAFATGLKLARPELNVVVVTGDGDGLAIGANHLIHAARRNIDITVMMLNNSIYGMTGGQVAPTTREGAIA
ncbi:MAG: thiamine pyrophosphate-dependent enzyme, partial [Acidimicrobiia bacterium]|nr:thiamine pyrophosphate-dependent enzyme [Acidimicrobiia bacterium]